MDSAPASGRSRSLTQEAFAAFLLWLSADHERAAKVYLDLRRTLVRYFVRKGCAHAEELTDKTLDRVVVIVHHEPGKYSNPVALCCGVARRVWLEYLREAVTVSLENENIQPIVQNSADFSDREVECLESCLDRLSSHDRELIIQYHQFQGGKKIETRKHLAQVHGGLNKLRITAYRIRVRLHDCVNDCLEESAQN
jgi:hypothetical protein